MLEKIRLEQHFQMEELPNELFKQQDKRKE